MSSTDARLGSSFLRAGEANGSSSSLDSFMPFAGHRQTLSAQHCTCKHRESRESRHSTCAAVSVKKRALGAHCPFFSSHPRYGIVVGAVRPFLLCLRAPHHLRVFSSCLMHTTGNEDRMRARHFRLKKASSVVPEGHVLVTSVLDCVDD